jgi:methionine synthase II (cobalamin-independent)
VAGKPLKVSLIGPDRVIQRFDHAESKAVYPSVEEFAADVVAIQRQMIRQLVDAGCRYVHIDEPGYTAYLDRPSLEAMRMRGEDPDANCARSLGANAKIIEGFPGVTFGIHLCRGNQRSMWHREGSYDAIAERLFNELPHRRFLLEYDSPRAGSFAPLRFVPKGKIVVLGLISTKVPELEPLDDLKRRVDEAAKYVPLEQLAVSPQCGFGSDVVGNLISEDDQKRKLERVVELARKVWA